ncbi:HAD family hydrolase [Streptomyces turgidiscabies]|uniref:HAD family hydrolase n=1 Tax=Streptomyces turgidiscabies TaxID=85558 RepID=UPI0038F5D297
MAEAERSLVLWDIDRTLLYVGEIDRQVYREAFAEIVGRPAERLPARGTGVTMPLAIRSLLLDNGVSASDVPQLLPRMVELLPQRLAAHEENLREQGVLMPGAMSALKAVHEQTHCVPTVVTGNLKPNALLKLEAFGLDDFLASKSAGTPPTTSTVLLSSPSRKSELRPNSGQPSLDPTPSSSETPSKMSAQELKAALR